MQREFVEQFAREAQLGGAAAQPGVLAQEVCRQPGNVLAAVAQWRYVNAELIKPVKEIFAEFPFADGRFEGRIGGGNYAHIQLHFHFATQAADALILQHPQ